MFVPRRQEHEIQPQSALHTARTAATPFKTSTRGHSERGQLVLTCLRRSELLTYPTGRHKTKYRCLAVSELDNLIPPELLPLSLSGMTVQRYGMVTTNADLQSSCFLGKSFWLGERLAATNLCQQGNDKSCLFCVEFMFIAFLL